MILLESLQTQEHQNNVASASRKHKTEASAIYIPLYNESGIKKIPHSQSRIIKQAQAFKTPAARGFWKQPIPITCTGAQISQKQAICNKIRVLGLLFQTSQYRALVVKTIWYKIQSTKTGI